MTAGKNSDLPLGRQGFAHPPRTIAALGIQSGMHVADFGSGSGAYVLGIAKQLEGSGHIYAIDVQRDLLRRVKNEAHKEGYKNLDIIWCDLEMPRASKLADRHLDLVLVSNLLFQVEKKEAVLAEAWRILKPSGRLAIIDWGDSFGGMGPQKRDVVSKDRALELARSSGFDLIKTFDAGAHHYGLLLKPIPHTL